MLDKQIAGSVRAFAVLSDNKIAPTGSLPCDCGQRGAIETRGILLDGARRQAERSGGKQQGSGLEGFVTERVA
ncbi:hypothetical protein KY49_4572 [Burkholderia sp. MSHR3999]|nr:hypothetical protein KY49_4572 [Burkholderia sp. MSHR3999]